MFLQLKTLKSVLILASVFFVNPASANAQTVEIIERSAVEFESKAQEAGRQWNGAAIRRAIDDYETAAKLWEKSGNFKKSFDCLREIAKLEILLGDYQSSAQKLKDLREREIKKGILPERAKTLSLLSTVLLNVGQIKESKVLSDEALKISTSVNDLTVKAMSFQSAGAYFYAVRDFQQAINFYKQAIGFWQEAGDIENEAQTLIDYGYIYMSLGEPLIGLNIVKDAENKLQKINNPRGAAISQIAIGHLYSALDEKQSALNFYLKAEKSFPTDFDFVEKARLFNGIGLIYEDYGEWKISLDYRRQALTLFQKENFLFGQLATLPSLIKLSHLVNDNDAAVKYFLGTRQLSKKLGENFFLAIAYKQMGDFHFKNQADQKALGYYQKSLEILKESGLKAEVALIGDKLGMIFERQKRYSLARTYYDSSLKICREISQKFCEAATLFNLAKLDILEGNDKDALPAITKSLEITESLSSDVSNSKLKTTYFSSVFDRYELYIGLLMKLHRQAPHENYSIEALRASERARARSMLETLALSEADFTKDANPETVRREKEIRALLNLKSDNLSDLLSRNDDQAAIDKLDGEINELTNELEKIKADLKQSSPLYSAIKNPAPFDIGEFQKRILDENSLLLEFSFGAQESHVWLVGKNKVSSYVLAPREEIEDQISKLRALLAAREAKKDESIEDYQARIIEADKNYWAQAHVLSDQLFGQIAGKIVGKRLIIVPDGKLHSFPVNALPLPNSEQNEPILLFNQTIYEPSAATLMMLSKSSTRTAAAAKDLIVFSDPIFTGGDTRLSAEKTSAENSNPVSPSTAKLRFAESLSNLPRLTASREEGDSIAGILGVSPANVFSGFAATRERVLSADVADYKIIHFATHGLVNEERPELSGIVLSGLDENGQKLEQVVRLQDIYGMNLNADLVVLSACQTGVGKEIRGEGLQSLSNGFLNVGAKSVVSSLWKVEDRATKELMTNFYTGLAAGNLTAAEALRQAQIKLWQNPQFKSPFYWAAFTLQGDLHNRPKLGNGFGSRAYLFLAAIPLLVFGIYSWRKKLNLQTNKQISKSNQIL